MILGAMIIKHKLNLSDAETVDIIRESPYMQYFCGLHEFTDKPIYSTQACSSRYASDALKFFIFFIHIGYVLMN